MDKILICATCPQECNLKIKFDENNAVYEVHGNKCQRGVKYAKIELTHPERILTSTVILKYDDKSSLLPVRSEGPLPKEILLNAIKVINKTVLKPPVKMNDVVIENILDSGVDIIASKSFL